MVKAVIGEETRLKLAEDRLSNSSVLSQVGLVIGKISSVLDRGFVFDLVPTPRNDAGNAASSVVDAFRDDNKRKGSKGKSVGVGDSASMFVDKDWVAEHARQVSRMSVGGIKVIGIYVWISESAFKNSTAELWQTIKGVAEATLLSGSDQDEMLLVHISYSPRRWTCRNSATTSNNISSLKPCDFKMGRVLNSLQKFRCTYNFTIRLPLTRESISKAQKFGDVLRSGIILTAKDLRNAKAIIDGNLVIDDEPATSEGYHDLELLVPFMKDTGIDTSSLNEVAGILLFSGSVSSYAFLNSKEPMSQAVSDIKGDIVTSLQSRLDIVLDEAEGDDQPYDNEKDSSTETFREKFVSRADLQSLSRKPVSLSFPRRVFIPWLAGTFICDYLQPSESLEVVKDHCAEMMSMEVFPDSSDILQPEAESVALVAESFWDIAVPFQPPSTSIPGKVSAGDAENNKDAQKAGALSSRVGTLGAIVVLMIAFLAGYLLLKGGAS